MCVCRRLRLCTLNVMAVRLVGGVRLVARLGRAWIGSCPVTRACDTAPRAWRLTRATWCLRHGLVELWMTGVRRGVVLNLVRKKRGRYEGRGEGVRDVA